jgi:hypothetical protein
VQVSAGYQHSCAVRSDGRVACWGANYSGQRTPAPLPSGVRYTQVSAGSEHSCAVRSDGQIACWGSDWAQQVTPLPLPAGVVYRHVEAEDDDSCALRSDGQVVCWGYGYVAWISPPALPSGGTYTGLSASNGHACVARSDGQVLCWGDNDYGQSMPPEGFNLLIPRPQTIAFTSTPPGPAVVGDSYLVSATGGGSENPVVFTALNPSVCRVNPSQNNTSVVWLAAAGTCAVAADQAGNAEYAAAPRVTQRFTVYGGYIP